MKKIKDGLLLGVIAGLGANLVKEVIAETSIGLGLSKYSCRRMIPHIVLPEREAKTWKGWIIGTTTDISVACGTGILLVYTLIYTGKDYAPLKGILVANGILDQVFNAFTQVLPAVKKDPNSNILCKMIHTLFGITTASIITRLGHETLFQKTPPVPQKTTETTREEGRVEVPERVETPIHH